MQEDVAKLYETYVSNIGSKHLGKKHVYEGDVCLYTGEKKSDITQKVYEVSDYFELLRTINEKNLMSVVHDDKYLDVLKNIDNLRKDNNILKDDAYLEQFFNLLIETKDKIKIDELWNDFDQQIKVEISETVDILEEVIGKSNSKLVENILTNLGSLNNIYEEKKVTNEADALKELYNNKIILMKKNTLGIYLQLYLKSNMSLPQQLLICMKYLKIGRYKKIIL